MDELSDLRIEEEAGSREPELEPDPYPSHRPAPPARSPVPWLLAALLVVGAALAWWLWSRRDPATQPLAELPAATAPAPMEPAVPAEEPVEPLVLPSLADSDPWIARLAATLSSHPELARWLAHEALLERFVVAVDNVAEGKSPRTHLRFAGPAEEFRAVEQAGALTVDPASYRRYDTAAAVITSLDAGGTAKLLSQIEPLLDQSYANLGYPNARFRDTLLKAIDALLAVPVPEAPLELKAKVSSYELADPRLEKLTEAQKHLLRMGPDHVQGIQAKLRSIRRALTTPGGG